MPVHNRQEQLYKAWKDFVSGGHVNSDLIRVEIAESWHRSKVAGVNPISGSIMGMVSEDELQIRCEFKRELLEISAPITKNLYNFVKGSGFIVSVIDQDGVILDSVGDPQAFEIAKIGNLSPGALMREELAGTNATGLALYSGKPMQVFAAEHYSSVLHPWTCSAAPILNHKGELVGLLSMTGTYEKVHSHTLGMVVAAADAIAGQLKMNKMLDNLMINTRYQNAIVDAMSEGLLAIDAQGRVSKINTAAATILRVNTVDVLKTPIEDLLGPKNPLRRTLINGEVTNDEEFQIVSSRGKIVCTITCRPIRNPQKKLVGVVAILREIKAVRKLLQRMVGGRARYTFEDLIGDNPAYVRTLDMAQKAAQSSSTVLLLGESGTGKEVFAQAIHNASERCDFPFVALNCAAIPRELIASELFGYTDGAFTGARRGGSPGKFELADGGTLFLDEIGEMPIELQSNLLRVLQEKSIVRIGGDQIIPINVRIIAATNKDLWEEVQQKRFRNDLFYRLNVFNINMVPLRHRKGDILSLSLFFINRFNNQLGKNIHNVHPEVLEILMKYNWPGNVRELENVIERAINVAMEDVLTPRDLPINILSNSRQRVSAETVVPESIILGTYIKLNKEKVQQAINSHEGNLTRAAQELGISRSTLYRKMEKYNLK